MIFGGSMEEKEIIVDELSLEVKSTSATLAACGIPFQNMGYIQATPMYFDHDIPINLSDADPIKPPVHLISTTTFSTSIPLCDLAYFLENLDAQFFAAHAKLSKKKGFYRFWNLSFGHDTPPVLRVSVSRKFESCEICILATCKKFNVVTYRQQRQFRGHFICSESRIDRHPDELKFFELAPCHPYKKIGKKALCEDVPNFHECFCSQVVSGSSINQQKQAMFHGSVEDIVGEFPGFVLVTVNPNM
jgi:hypothetical protein